MNGAPQKFPTYAETLRAIDVASPCHLKLAALFLGLRVWGAEAPHPPPPLRGFCQALSKQAEPLS